MIPNAMPPFDFGLGETADALRDQIQRFASAEVAPIAAEIDKTDRFPRELDARSLDLEDQGAEVRRDPEQLKVPLAEGTAGIEGRPQHAGSVVPAVRHSGRDRGCRPVHRPRADDRAPRQHQCAPPEHRAHADARRRERPVRRRHPDRRPRPRHAGRAT